MTEQTRQLGMRLPLLLIRRVDAEARLREMNRTDTVVELLTEAMDARMARAMGTGARGGSECGG